MTSDAQDQDRSWRPWSWLMVGWTVGAIVLGLVVLLAVGDTCMSMSGLGLSLCEANVSIGSLLGVLGIFAVWLMGLVLLAVGWVARRPARRLCPPYGHAVDEGDRICSRCGYDFILGRLPPGHPAGADVTVVAVAGSGSPADPVR